MILRARVVVPVSHPAVEDGAVVVSAGRVTAVGRWGQVGRGRRVATVDLGDVALVPGFVDAHCHLDYTDMTGQLVPPSSFVDWIKSITETKAGWGYSDYAASWLRGAGMLLASGTTTVGDIEAVPDLLPEVWVPTPLRIISFLELTGVRARRRPQAILDDAVAKIHSLPLGRCRASLSPHAPYSTTPALLSACARVARGRRWRLSIHVAESAEEWAMFRDGRGPMYAWIARNQRDMSDCGGITPVQHLARYGLLGDHLLAVHANYLGADDASLLARHGVHVVHCPRSHAYFGHARFPAADLIRQGVSVSLGTDSLATVFKARRESVQLDLRAEARAYVRAHRGQEPEAVLRMITLHPAHALGLRGLAGEICPGAFADLAAFPFGGGPAEAPEAVLHTTHPASRVMIGGQWVYPPLAT